MPNTQQLEYILKQEIETIDLKLKKYNSMPLIKSIFDKLNGDFYNLITLSYSEIETLSNLLDLKIINETIRKAVLFQSNSVGLKNIKQYKQYQDVMNDLKSVYSFIKEYVEYDIDKLIQEENTIKEEYQRLLKETKGNRINVSNISISSVLSILDRLKLEANSENKILIDLILESLREKEDGFEESLLSEEEQNIFDLAEELLKEKEEEIRLFVGPKQYAGYIGMLEQNLEDTIDNPEIKAKIELLQLNKYVNEIKEWLNWYNSNSNLSLNEKDNILSEIKELIAKIKPLVIKNKSKEKKEDKYKLIFFDSAKEDFYSENLKFSSYRNQMISILSELRNGKFNGDNKVTDTPYDALKIRRKYNVRSVYLPIHNNIILVFAIRYIDTIDGRYMFIKRKINNNLKLIDYIIEQSKTEEGVKQLLQGSEEINKELDELIELKNQSLEGGNYAK